MNAIKGELCNGSQGNVVGSKVVRVDGYEKVTGKAIYGDDIQLNKMLHAACRFTDIPAGKIKKLDISKARTHLKWEPTWNLETTLTRIVNWHRAWLQGDDMHARCVEEINSYMAAMPLTPNR